MKHTEGSTGTHPPESELVERYVAGRLSEAEASDFEAHYFGCDECWSAVRRAVELRTAFADLQKAPAGADRWTRGRRGPGRHWQPLLAAAVAALALGTWLFTRDTAGPDPVLRSPLAALAVSLHDGPDALTAAWEPVPGADVYQVRLFTPDGSLALDAETADTFWVATRAHPGAVDPGSTRFLQIQAVDPLRRPLARSRLLEVTTPVDRR